MQVYRRLYCEIVSRATILRMILSIIEWLKRTNRSVSEFLSEAHERTRINILVKRLRVCWYIDFHYFDEMYKLFVERKRRRLLADINANHAKCIEYIRDREMRGRPHEPVPIGWRMEKAVLDTYHAFLQNDDAYQQKAFLEFLKKKIEDGDDRQSIKDYMEMKYKHSSYEEYERLEYGAGSILTIELRDLWLEFFKSGTGYECMIPEDRPKVAYWSTSEDVPRFVFEQPYVGEFSEQEFYDRFVKEWNITNKDPEYVDAYEDPTYRYEYGSALGETSKNAYDQYMGAVLQFKQLQERAERDGGSTHHS